MKILLPSKPYHQSFQSCCTSKDIVLQMIYLNVNRKKITQLTNLDALIAFEEGYKIQELTPYNKEKIEFLTSKNIARLMRAIQNKADQRSYILGFETDQTLQLKQKMNSNEMVADRISYCIHNDICTIQELMLYIIGDDEKIKRLAGSTFILKIQTSKEQTQWQKQRTDILKLTADQIYPLDILANSNNMYYGL